MGVSHSLRVGATKKPLMMLRTRASGKNFYSSAAVPVS
jgi:hypothetical protein